jgi:predicted HTH domain antitoxin
MKRKKKKYIHGKAYEWSKKEIEDIIELYVEEKKTLADIAKLYGVSQSSIRIVLHKNNINRRSSGGIPGKKIYRKYTANYNYFDEIDTEYKAYWLGFIAADGCIAPNHGSYHTTISLNQKDKNHIEKYLNCIDSNHKIYSIHSQSTVTIFNKHLAESLINLGLSVSELPPD